MDLDEHPQRGLYVLLDLPRLLEASAVNHLTHIS